MYNNPEFWALVIAGISLLTGTFIAPYLTHGLSLARMRRELEQGKELAVYQARTNYEVEAQRRFAEVIGQSKSQVIDAAYMIHRRLDNLHTQSTNDWDGGESWLAGPGYYRSTSVYRIARLFAWAEIMNSSLTYVDQSIPGAKQERAFLGHLRLIRNSFSDIRLFEGLDYDNFYQTEHIFDDNLAAMGQQLVCRDDASPHATVMDVRQFRTKFEARGRESAAFRKSFEPLTRFLSGFTRPTDQPLKWARLLALHYSTGLLLHRFGYDFQRENQPDRVLVRLDLVGDQPNYAASKIRANLDAMVQDCRIESADEPAPAGALHVGASLRALAGRLRRINRTAPAQPSNRPKLS